jgi:hypothetical protein
MMVPTIDFRFIGIGAQVGCTTLVIVLAAVFGGIWLDRLLGTRPVLTLIFVLGSAPFSLVLTYYIAIRQVRRMQSGPISGAPIAKEDDKSGTKD